MFEREIDSLATLAAATIDISTRVTAGEKLTVAKFVDLIHLTMVAAKGIAGVRGDERKVIVTGAVHRAIAEAARRGSFEADWLIDEIGDLIEELYGLNKKLYKATASRCPLFRVCSSHSRRTE